MRRPPPWLAVLALGGCLLSPVDAEQVAIYPLQPRPQSAPGRRVTWQLAVEEPFASDTLATARIAVRERDRAYSVLRGARWSDPVPALVQELCVRSFEDSGRIRGAVRAATGVHSDYRLFLEIRAFEVDYDGPGAPAASIAWSANLVRSSTSRVVAARVFRGRVRATADDAAAMVAAFEQAAAILAGKLTDWIVEAADRDWHENHEPKDKPTSSEP